MRYFLSLFVLTLPVFSVTDVTAQQAKLLEDGVAGINQFFHEAVEQKKIPAVEAIIVGKDRILYHEVHGKRNAGENIDLQKGDLFDIASMTKPVTAVAVMILYDEGKLDLDDPVSKYLPAFKDLEVMTAFNEKDTTYTSTPPKTRITIRHLLSNTSGMGYPWFYKPLHMLDEKRGGEGFRFVYDYMQLPLLYEPGTGWSYGISYQALGSLVEEVSGQRLDAFFEERIFDPLGMNNTFYEIPEHKLERRVTIQVFENDDWTEQPLPEIQEPLIIGDATLISTGYDYARFLQMLLNIGVLDGKRVLSEHSIGLMTQNQIGELVVEELFNGFPVGSGQDKFGYGFQIAVEVLDDTNSRTAGSYSWAGSNNTFFWVDPKSGIAAVLLMHYLPFHDETALMVYDGFEQRIYQSLN